MIQQLLVRIQTTGNMKENQFFLIRRQSNRCMDAVSGIFKPPHLLARNTLKLALQALWFESSVNFFQQACRDQKLASSTSSLVHEKLQG
jgi:hypothetical protein